MLADRQPNQLATVTVLLALSGLLLFLGLGDMGLTDRDEGRNAEAGREMFASGDLVTPTFNGELRVANTMSAKSQLIDHLPGPKSAFARILENASTAWLINGLGFFSCSQ